MSYYVEINKNIIPYTFQIQLVDEMYEFRVDYSSQNDLFTISLSKNGIKLCDGEPIIYGQPLFGDFKNRGGFPLITITPVDKSGEYNAVTFDNLSQSVMLIVGTGDS